jgi:hypothetical protein
MLQQWQQMHPATPYLIGWGICGFLMGMFFMFFVYRYTDSK